MSYKTKKGKAMNRLLMLAEEYASVNKIAIYHANRNNRLANTKAQDDYNAGNNAGIMHGKGIYTVWKKESLRSNYGAYVNKGYVDINKFKILILDPEFYKEIKKEIPKNFVEDQLRAVGITDLKGIRPRTYENGKICDKGRPIRDTSSSGYLLKLEEKIRNLHTLFDGCAYDGRGDGNCLLMWNEKAVIITGVYDIRSGKTIDKKENIKNVIRQKHLASEKHENKTVYSNKVAKIAERKQKYLFFEKKGKGAIKPLFWISRTQKRKSENTFKNIDLIADFAKRNSIPERIIKSLTFTNGVSIIDREGTETTIKRRRGSLRVNFDFEDIREDIENETIVDKMNIILKKTKMNSKDKEYLEQITKFSNYHNNSHGEEIIIQMKKTPLVIRKFGRTQQSFEFNRNCIFDMNFENKIELRYHQYDRNKRFIMRGRNVRFRGSFINIPTIIKIGWTSAYYLFEKSGVLDLTTKFDGKTVVLDYTDFDNNSKIHKFSGCTLLNADPEYLDECKTLPPVEFDDRFASTNITIKSAESIDFGNNKKHWKLPISVNKVFYSNFLNVEALKELKKRNPDVIFEEKTKL